jgi:hypothetical protein
VCESAYRQVHYRSTTGVKARQSPLIDVLPFSDLAGADNGNCKQPLTAMNQKWALTLEVSCR